MMWLFSCQIIFQKSKTVPGRQPCSKPVTSKSFARPHVKLYLCRNVLPVRAWDFSTDVVGIDIIRASNVRVYPLQDNTCMIDWGCI